MSVEEAKGLVLTPPPAPPGRSGVALGPVLLAGAAAVAAGLLLSNPARARRLARRSTKLLRSPMVKRALVTFAASALGARKAAG